MKRNSGFFKLAVIIFVGLVVLAYFQVDVKGYAESPRWQAIIGKTTDIGVYIWDGYLKRPTLYVYNDVLKGVVWPTIKSHLPKGDSATTTPEVAGSE